ncbi:Bgt-3157 [Blumeria graminis f. sp. tritici]|nr:Bgt-3157 [Blumeria graminis f. sp. tritici]
MNYRRCLVKLPCYSSQFPLFNLSLQVISNAVLCIPFSTTANRKADRNGPPKKGTSSLRITKKAPVKEKGKPPAQGERKAMRKRIVLSNTNALEVELPEFNNTLIRELLSKAQPTPIKNKSPTKQLGKDKGSETSENTPAVSALEPASKLIGSVIGLSDKVIDGLRAANAFKITQSWRLFRQPGILIREESRILTELMVQAQENKQTLRLVIDGAKGTGKSMLLIHAISTGLIRDWIVINIPEAQEVTNAVTDYAPIPDSDLWCQNNLIAELLSKIAQANSVLLDSLPVTQIHRKLPAQIDSSTSIHRLCELGAREPDISWPFFLAFWAEITAQGRPPILMCLDGLSHILQNSLYLKPDLSHIHAQDLALIRHFTDYLSGARSLSNGGAFLAATSRSHSPISPTLELSVKRWEERMQKLEESKMDPYEKKYDTRSEKVLSDVEFLKLGGLTKDETKGLLEYWAKSGLFRSKVDDATVVEKWVLSGHGNAAEIQRSSLWMRV